MAVVYPANITSASTPVAAPPLSLPDPSKMQQLPGYYQLLVAFISTPEVMLLLSVVSLLALMFGYKLFSLVHKCKNATLQIASEYLRDEAHIQRTKAAIVHSQSRLTIVSRMLVAAFIIILFLAILLFFLKGIRDVLPLKIVLAVTCAAPLVLYMLKLYYARSFARHKDKLANLEKGQQKRLGDVLGALPVSMRVDMQKRFLQQSQKSIEQNEVRIKRTEKECLGTCIDAERHGELIGQLCEFAWCDHCKLLKDFYSDSKGSLG